MKKPLFLLVFIMLFFVSCGTTNLITTKTENSEIKITKIDNFETEITGLNANKITFPFFTTARISALYFRINDNIKYTEYGLSEKGTFEEKIYKINILSDSEFFYDNLIINVSENKIKIDFENLTFGRTKKEIENENQKREYQELLERIEAQKLQEAQEQERRKEEQKKESCPALNNFLGIKFHTNMYDVLSKLNELGYIAISKSKKIYENGIEYFYEYDIREYEGEKTSSVIFRFFNEDFNEFRLKLRVERKNYIKIGGDLRKYPYIQNMVKKYSLLNKRGRLYTDKENNSVFQDCSEEYSCIDSSTGYRTYAFDYYVRVSPAYD